SWLLALHGKAAETGKTLRRAWSAEPRQSAAKATRRHLEARRQCRARRTRRQAAAARAKAAEHAGQAAALAFGELTHGLHHVRHLAVHLQETIDLGNLRTRTFGDALLAARIEEIGVLALLGRHRLDDRFLALENLLVEIGLRHLLLDLGDAGKKTHEAL